MSGLGREELRARFSAGDRWFHDSPLYRALARVVADDERLLDLADLSRPGQQPTNLLMAATHMLVLDDPAQPFARFFPTAAALAGATAEDAPERAAAEYPGFCAAHHDELVGLLRERLVQTNEPARATALRLALHEVGRRVPGPVTFLEIGASAGIQLRFDAWAIETAGLRFGPPDAPLTVHTEWRAVDGTPPPDLDAVVSIGERLGIDLHPLDATDPSDRRWLQALVWPEHVDRFVALGRALDAVVADPPEIVAGDAVDALPDLDARRLAADRPLVVFHSQVRIHVPETRRAAFDAGIGALAARRRLLHVALEHRDDGPAVLSLADSEGEDVDLGRAHGHGRWIAPERRPTPASA